jgi:integrase
LKLDGDKLTTFRDKKGRVGLAEKWTGRQLADIRKREIIAELDVIADRAPVMANRTHATLRKLYSWAVRRDLIETNPCKDMDPPGGKETARDRVLPDAELVAVWNACDRLGYPFGPLVRVMILSAQREGECAGWRRSEINRDTAVWSLSRDRVKNGQAHTVPLSPEVLDILDGLPRIGDTDLYFTDAATDYQRPVSGFSHAQERLRELAGLAEHWTWHDLRRTCTTGMARLKIADRNLAKRVLNHVQSARQDVTNIYDRHDYLDERRAAIEAWAKHVLRLVNPPADNVVQLRETA